MKQMAVSQFKARALELLEQVSRTREEIIITKRGKPMARILPYEGGIQTPVAGTLAHTLEFEHDILSPLGEDPWEAAS